MGNAADQLQVRPATAADMDACARLMSSSEPWLTLGRDYNACLDLLNDPERDVFVAQAPEFVGVLVLYLHGILCGYIQSICLVPEARGRGLGTALLRWAEERILRESPNVFLCVSNFNTAARRLYERLGFKLVGELTDFIVPGHAELLLRKSVGSWAEFRAPDAGGT